MKCCVENVIVISSEAIIVVVIAHRVSGLGCRISQTSPHSTAHLQRLAGTNPVSL